MLSQQSCDTSVFENVHQNLQQEGLHVVFEISKISEDR